MDNIKYPDIEVQLTGTDSHAISIMTKVKKALLRNGVTSQEANAFQEEALSGDYNNVLQTAMKWVTVL